MASGYLRTIACGNIGNDAELKNFDWGSVCDFSVACTETWKNKDGSKGEHTEWIRCQLTGKRAKALARYSGVRSGGGAGADGRQACRRLT